MKKNNKVEYQNKIDKTIFDNKNSEHLEEDAIKEGLDNFDRSQ